MDGGSRGDAERLVAGVPNPEQVLWAGSANLARAIGATFEVPENNNFEIPEIALSTLIALGGHPQNLEQLKVLKANGLSIIQLEPTQNSITRAITEATTALKTSGCVLHLEPQSFGIPANQAKRTALEALAETIALLSSSKSFENLLLCGTPIATSVMRRLSAQGIHSDPFTDSTHLLAPNPHRIKVRASSDAPQTLLGAYQLLAG